MRSLVVLRLNVFEDVEGGAVEVSEDEPRRYPGQTQHVVDVAASAARASCSASTFVVFGRTSVRQAAITKRVDQRDREPIPWWMWLRVVSVVQCLLGRWRAWPMLRGGGRERAGGTLRPIRVRYG